MKSTLEKTVDKTDVELKDDVLAELRYQPGIKVTDLGVLVNEGIVTLNGHTSSYNGKWEVVRAVKRIAGVKAIAGDIEVKFPGSVSYTDADITAAAEYHFKWSTTVPKGVITAIVRYGWITLEGEVEWWYQRNAASNIVHYLLGVKGVSNMISIKPKLTTTEAEMAIRSAFERSALLDSNEVQVETSGSEVILRGKVRNYLEKDEAERAAWAAPGVLSVENHLILKWSNFSE